MAALPRRGGVLKSQGLGALSQKKKNAKAGCLTFFLERDKGVQVPIGKAIKVPSNAARVFV
jgi:hypothetical protein